MKSNNNIKNSMFNLAHKLWPLHRSIMGKGTFETLKILKKKITKLKIYKFKTGTKIFDWTVPNEWIINDAWIKNENGKKIIDLKKNNLHVVAYSNKINKFIKLEELKSKIYSSKTRKNAIPYVTSFYKKDWGFCLSYNQKKKLKKGVYHVFIDSKFKKGNLLIGEFFLPGRLKKEILLSTYICHPSMANNELSGPVVLTQISKWLSEIKNRKYSYRIVFAPETIGTLAHIKKDLEKLKNNMIAGFNITCVGDERNFSYLQSRDGFTYSDRIAKHVLKWIYPKYKSYDWTKRGSAERQYCSPNLNLPVATIMKTKFGMYPEYHTSDDKLGTVVTKKGLFQSYEMLKKMILIIENDDKIQSNFIGEPQLSKRNLYPHLSFGEGLYETKFTQNTFNLLTYADGEKSLLEIAEKLNVPCWELFDVKNILIKKKLIKYKKKS